MENFSPSSKAHRNMEKFSPKFQENQCMENQRRYIDRESAQVHRHRSSINMKTYRQCSRRIGRFQRTGAAIPSHVPDENCCTKVHRALPGPASLTPIRSVRTVWPEAGAGDAQSTRQDGLQRLYVPNTDDIISRPGQVTFHSPVFPAGPGKARPENAEHVINR